MSNNNSLSQLLSNAGEVFKTINKHGDAVKSQLDAKQPFNTQGVKTELEADLHQIQDYVMNFSKRCLTQLIDWNNMLVGMDAEINEVEGLIQSVKSDAGSRIVSPILCEGGQATPDDDYEFTQTAPFFNFPEYKFDINMLALDNVGHQVEEVENPELSEYKAPLLTKIPPGEAPPLFWSTTQDFFTPAMDLQMTVGDEAFQTSFSDFYKFDAVPQIVRDQREAMGRR
ncbi:hypothetical protein GPJ56_005674 [Histomonas meleagridis]|uniref:uncharacterized protein n=1 Tax=Histomonas meleagridis TaxID=135588 RepID=UPI00355ABB00|nr:hypothetical protein GPJ56_005674 [Histomonas meleagridis]KAH0803391.1 hypothetical protein GO595_003735 [Histomonas meleagridis]